MEYYLNADEHIIRYSKKSKVNREEAAGSHVPSLSNDSPYFDTTVAQNADGVNTQSMQEGGGYTQNAFLPADQFVDRMAATPSVTADAVPPPSEREAMRKMVRGTFWIVR